MIFFSPPLIEGRDGLALPGHAVNEQGCSRWVPRHVGAANLGRLVLGSGLATSATSIVVLLLPAERSGCLRIQETGFQVGSGRLYRDD